MRAISNSSPQYYLSLSPFSLTKDERLMNTTEMRMLRWIEGISLRDQISHEEIRKAATVQPITTHMMQKRLYAGSNMSDVEMIASDGNGSRKCDTQS